MNVKISMTFICVEVIIYLLLCNLHVCTFKIYKLFINFFVDSLSLFVMSLEQKVLNTHTFSITPFLACVVKISQYLLPLSKMQTYHNVVYITS